MLGLLGNSVISLGLIPRSRLIGRGRSRPTAGNTRLRRAIGPLVVGSGINSPYFGLSSPAVGLVNLLNTPQLGLRIIPVRSRCPALTGNTGVCCPTAGCRARLAQIFVRDPPIPSIAAVAPQGRRLESPLSGRITKRTAKTRCDSCQNDENDYTGLSPLGGRRGGPPNLMRGGTSTWRALFTQPDLFLQQSQFVCRGRFLYQNQIISQEQFLYRDQFIRRKMARRLGRWWRVRFEAIIGHLSSHILTQTARTKKPRAILPIAPAVPKAPRDDLTPRPSKQSIF